MNILERRLAELDSILYSRFQETKVEVTLMLAKYASNFPTYTDHSSSHTLEVFKIASELLSEEEIGLLCADEIYILSMACLLHDIGMCVPDEKISEISQSQEILEYKLSHPNLTTEEFIRDIHHKLSNKFIVHEWENLKIQSLKYAKAIGLVAEGHRKTDLGNFEIYEPQYFAKSGKEFACLPYIASILRIADELDVTNSRTPRILTKYYMPNNEVSIREWTKHIATSQRNYLDNKVIFEVDCSDQNIYAALQEQFDKIQNVINNCQKIIRAIPFMKSRNYTLSLSIVEVKYNFVGFHPKGIRFSFDVQNVVTAFIGEDLYKDKMTSLREAVQNSIDSCRYKSKVLKEEHSPFIKIWVSNECLSVEDNGAGMDEFIVENYFGRLASSFYEQEKIKSQFEAIGQFGVGVFSYFLLSEFIDIETKTSKNATLKFRFDKDPKSYFHFYDKTDRITPGTTITMYLKKELVGKLTFNLIENYIRKIFNHIEIPIEICDTSNRVVIDFQPFLIDTEFEIRTRLKLPEKSLASQLTSIDAYIDNEEYRGICSLIIGKNYLDTFIYSSTYFDYEQFKNIGRLHSLSQISISQKGVFVNYYSSASMALLIGDIDIKKKIKINIDRNEFTSEEQLLNIIQTFEVKILSKLFESLELKYKNDNERFVISDSFINNCLRLDRKVLSQEYLDILLKSLYFHVIYNRSGRIKKWGEVIGQYNEFIIVDNAEDSANISIQLKKPVIIANEIAQNGLFQKLIYVINYCFDYQRNIIELDGRYFRCFQKKIFKKVFVENVNTLDEIIGTKFYQFADIKSMKVVMRIWHTKSNSERYYYDYEDVFLNINHKLFLNVIQNQAVFKENVEFSKALKSILEYLLELAQETVDNEDVAKLNNMLKHFNLVFGDVKFSINDF